jgi:hypothetical protein
MAKPALVLQPAGAHTFRNITRDGVIIGRAVKQASGGYGGGPMWDIWYGGSPVEMFGGTARDLQAWLATDPTCLRDKA